MRRLRILPLLVVLATALACAAPALAENPVVPKATTGAVSGVGQTTATVAGSVDPEGSATTYQFEYGTTTTYGLTTTAKDAGDGTEAVAVTAALSGLTSDTTYHYRVVATNAAGVTRGSDKTLRTAKVPRSPVTTTGAAKEIATTSATLTASVDPRGPATTVSFEYGTSTKYGAKSGVATVDGFGNRTVSLPISGLAPYTKYYYRVVAVNEKGTARGSSRNLTTLRAPTTIELTSVPTAIGWGGSATVAGRVQGAGVGKIGVRVERTDFPFSATTFKDVTSASDGTFRATLGPIWITTHLRAITRSTLVAASPTVTVHNRLKVGMRAGDKTRRTVRLSGSVQPGVGTTVVSIQRRSANGTRWVRVARTTVTVRNAFTARYGVVVKRTRRASTFRAVAVPHDNGAHASGTSRELRIAGRAR